MGTKRATRYREKLAGKLRIQGKLDFLISGVPPAFVATTGSKPVRRVILAVEISFVQILCNGSNARLMSNRLTGLCIY
jgi:hypothetical protein